MKRYWRFLSTWTLLLFYSSSRRIDGKLVSANIERNLYALAKVVDYIRHRPQQMNADVTFSITIVEANIAATLLHENASCLEVKSRRKLVTILKLCDRIRRHLLDTIVPDDENVRLLHEELNNPILWMRKISWRDGVLQRGRANASLTDRDVRRLLMQGTPNEAQSDRCLADMIRRVSNFDGSIPELCVEILMEPDSTRGYPLTHRLLIVQLVKAMKHDQALPVSSSELTVFYCSKILRDLTDIEAAGFPYDTPDLMMEEVLLCGMEGFLEFTGDHYERLIANWSHPSGCFSSFGNRFFNNQIQVSRRSTIQTDFGCDSHATGLAAASLSLFVRENVENSCD